MTRERIIRTIALRDVLDGTDLAYRRRQIHRWFAEHFATSLWEVEHDLDEDYVLRHFYEARYEELRDAADGPDDAASTRLAREDLAQLRLMLSMTEEEFVEARREEEAEAEEAAEYLRREQAREARDAPAPRGLTPDQFPPDVVLEFPVDLDRDPLGGGLLDD